MIPFEKYRKIIEENQAEPQTSAKNIRNTHTCNGSTKEKSAENNLLRIVTKFDKKKKLYTSRNSVYLSRINTKKAMPRCSIIILLKDKEKILKVAREA